MRLFVAADIHGNFDNAELMIKAFEASGASHLLLLGDILNHGPRNAIPEGYAPAKVAQLLNQYSAQILAVRGNCDSEVDQMLLDFPILADYGQLLLGQRKVFYCHGHLYKPDDLPELASGDVFISGHSHNATAMFRGDVYLCNPGAISVQKGDSPLSYGILQASGFEVFALSDDSLFLKCQF
ncbi:phosphodiesterase [Alginatibacterium sediminis]|uniref:Phosphoesterase n=1 Tax=Alginatibacterium sediminis TaxID=2164068 RepID=A0A420E8Z4_9ALTE|nr:phosphodiesterase [Alginatibacterium sediminis]